MSKTAVVRVCFSIVLQILLWSGTNYHHSYLSIKVKLSLRFEFTSLVCNSVIKLTTTYLTYFFNICAPITIAIYNEPAVSLYQALDTLQQCS